MIDPLRDAIGAAVEQVLAREMRSPTDPDAWARMVLADTGPSGLTPERLANVIRAAHHVGYAAGMLYAREQAARRGEPRSLEP